MKKNVIFAILAMLTIFIGLGTNFQMNALRAQSVDGMDGTSGTDYANGSSSDTDTDTNNMGTDTNNTGTDTNNTGTDTNTGGSSSNAKSCYDTDVLDCPFTGGSFKLCTFTGDYGNPYQCEGTTCLGTTYTRHCVKK